MKSFEFYTVMPIVFQMPADNMNPHELDNSEISITGTLTPELQNYQFPKHIYVRYIIIRNNYKLQFKVNSTTNASQKVLKCSFNIELNCLYR